MAYYNSSKNSADNYTFDNGSIEERERQEEERRKKRRVYNTKIIDSLIKEKNDGYEIPYDAFFMRDTELRAPGVTFCPTDEEWEIMQECRDNPTFYVDNFCKFLTDEGRVTVTLRDYQRKAINLVTEETYIEKLQNYGPKNRNIIWMASRQMGKTTTIAAFLSWMIVFHSNRNILVVANKEKTAIEIIDKITNIFRGLPYYMKPGCMNFGKMSVKLENGSQIICSATTNTASIGFTIHCVLLDEFAHIPDNIVNNFWRSVYPTLSSSEISQCIITSTPNGTTNKFYEIWSKSKEGKNSFVNMRTDYYEAPGHDQEWADKMRADFGEEEFAQEFELQFNINSKMLAKTDDLQFMGRIAKDYVHKTILTDYDILNDEGITWHPDFDPNDVPEKAKFIILIDLAEGLNDSNAKTFKNNKRDPDYNTANILMVVPNSYSNMRKYAHISCQITDAFRFIQVGKYTSNEKDEVYCAKVCSALCYDWLHDDDKECVKVMVEMNFNGKSFTEQFQRHPKYYDGTIQRTYHTKPVPGEKQRRRLGFKTTSDKEAFCLKGAKQMNMKRIIVTDRETMNQVQSFGYVKNKLMGIACHDDLSMPLFNDITRMLADDTFKEWLEDILENMEDETLKYKINFLLEKWALDNPELSDSEFDAMYNKGNNTLFSPDGQSMNPYSENNMYPGTAGFGGSGFGGPNPYSSGGGFNPYSGR